MPLMTYYCSKCKCIRQFFVNRDEEEPECCGRILSLEGKHVLLCGGDLQPVVNVHHVIAGGENAAI